jgi:hypothetical protein
MENKQPFTYLIGHTRTIQTAVLVVAYLQQRFFGIPLGQIKYRFIDPTSFNGWCSAEIILESELYDYNLDNLKLVSICRAFVAGRGEIWA